MHSSSHEGNWEKDKLNEKRWALLKKMKYITWLECKQELKNLENVKFEIVFYENVTIVFL